VPRKLSDAIDFISKAELAGGKILVHCPTGKITSPGVVIAFLISHYFYTYKKAYQLVEDLHHNFFLFSFTWESSLRNLHRKMVSDLKEGKIPPTRTQESPLTDQDFEAEGKVLSPHFTGYLPSKILDHLYVGGLEQVQQDNLLNLGIHNVLSVADDINNLSYSDDSISHRLCLLADDGSSDLSAIFDQCIEFIEEAKQKGQKCIVHCKWGINRSVSVVIAYLMTKFDMSLTSAWRYVLARRPVVNPVTSYMKQLLQLEANLGRNVSLPLAEVGDFLVSEW